MSKILKIEAYIKKCLQLLSASMASLKLIDFTTTGVVKIENLSATKLTLAVRDIIMQISIVIVSWFSL